MSVKRIKIFKNQSPKQLEQDFNSWASNKDLQIVEHQIQYSPSLQHFLLSAIYEVDAAEDEVPV